MLTLDLSVLPSGTRLRSVSAEPAQVAGRRALRLSLTDEAASGTSGVDFVDMPTFAILPVDLRNGTVSVDILSRLLPGAPDYARAFAGLAYRVVDEGDAFEAIYARPLNGQRLNPPPPRDRRAIQYFAYPDWKFDRLRETFPDGPYESGADIAPDEWFTLNLDIEESSVAAGIDGRPVLSVPQPRGRPRPGAIGLWVDIGTEAYFSNLRVGRRD